MTDEPEERPRCVRCGRAFDPEDDAPYAGTGLCADCYWDDQTDADGAIGDEDDQRR